LKISDVNDDHSFHRFFSFPDGVPGASGSGGNGLFPWNLWCARVPENEREVDHRIHSIFSYFLTPDYDFRQDVLSFGDSVEVDGVEKKNERNN